LSVRGDAPQVQPADLDRAFRQLQTYTWSESREPLNAIETAIAASAGDPAGRKQLEARLAAVLRTGSPFPAKQYVCRKLSQIGTANSIPILAPLLLDPALSHPARFALERIPDPGAAAALRGALPRAEGNVKVGIINSLGVLKDAAAVGLLINLLANPDDGTATAAATALGHIATVEAARALGEVRAARPVQAAVTQARLLAAGGLLQRGHRVEAAGIFRQLYSPAQAAPVRLAALRGLVAAEPERAFDLLSHAIAGGDGPERDVAARIIGDASAVPDVKRFVDSFPTCTPTGQAVLLEAFRSRCEPAARPIALAATESSDPRLRVAGLRALMTIGTAADVPILAGRAAGEGEERNLARAALASLPGTDINGAMLSALSGSAPEIKVELLEALAARGAEEAGQSVATRLTDASEAVRIAALRTLAVLGGGGQVAAVMSSLNATNEPEREAAQSALAAMAKREGARCADDVLKGLEGASAESRISLLRALGMAGGPKALEAVRAALADDNPRVKEGAFRVLTEWSSVDAAPDLLRLARTAPEPNWPVLAFRGYVRLCREGECSSEERTRLLGEAMKAARDAGEQRLVIAALGEQQGPETLKLLEPCFEDATLMQEACLAVVKIATDADAKSLNDFAPSLRRVSQVSTNQDAREKARAILQRLGAKSEPISE